MWLAHISFRKRGGPRVGRYGVDLRALDTLAVRAVHQAVDARTLVVIDEIGPMELLSPAFRRAVIRAVEEGEGMVATVAQRPHPFVQTLQARPGVELVVLSPENREGLVEALVTRLRRWPCCRPEVGRGEPW
ncbi:MAG: nucleoside-triphosphatase [Ardenticatenia bacterium]|nr:nucleoside-triphosphatase [Ardenticatenia bacterium]